MKRCLLALLLCLGACDAKLPAVDEGAFACIDDLVAEDGLLQCPASHWCDDGACQPRLACSEPFAQSAACMDGLERCELTATGTVAAVSCERGLHLDTLSSTVARPHGTCDCPDGTWCVAYGDGIAQIDEETRALFVLPAGRSFPAAQFGTTAERAGIRVCARGCSGELDCPPSHTCRAAPVVQKGLLEDPSSSRHTVGVCYPDRIETSTTSQFPEVPAQPDPDYCQIQADCSDRTPSGQICQMKVVVVSDHPSVPAGEAWGEHMALVSRCRSPNVAGLIAGNDGCAMDSVCKSGVCKDGRCAALCDPSAPTPCMGGRTCSKKRVSREILGGTKEVEDVIWLCPF